MSEVNNPTEPARVKETKRGLQTIGSDGQNRFQGGDENDVIRVFKDDDEVAGGGGKDKIILNQGDDIGYGNDGNDIIRGGQGEDTLYGGDGNDKIRGGPGDDTLYGEAGKDKIKAGRGDDVIFGGLDNDTINAQGGNDTVEGGEGDDKIKGGSGNDILVGGAGDDRLTGQRGSDTFVLDVFNNGTDTITDFTAGTDKIALRVEDAGLVTDSTGAVSFEAVNNVTALGASSAKVVYNAATGEVLYNPSATAGDEVVLANLDPGLDIQSTDFEVF